MPTSSPMIEGFRAVLRRPSLALAETAWRWTVGAAASALLLFACFEFLDSLMVAPGDSVLLKTRQPLLVGRALNHILRGSMNRAMFAVLFAVIALSLLWIIAASLGRAATVRALLDYFGSSIRPKRSSVFPTQSAAIRSLLGLNLLRVAAALAALLAFVGAAIVASFASPEKNPQPGLALNIFALLVALIAGIWFGLNWLLSLAGIFAVRDGDDALGSVSSAVAFVRERATAITAISGCIGLAHLVAFCLATGAVTVVLAFVHFAPARLMDAIVIVITLAYFVFADWLYIARLARYICILETPDVSPAAVSLPVLPLAGAVDRDELILGDLPGQVLET